MDPVEQQNTTLIHETNRITSHKTYTLVRELSLNYGDTNMIRESHFARARGCKGSLQHLGDE